MSAADERPCIERGEHVLTQRHSRLDCPTRASADNILTEVAVEQGWNVGTQMDLALRYIDMLGRPERPASFEDFLRGIARDENRDSDDPPQVPMFVKDITGRSYGGAYWNEADYRLRIQPNGDMFLLSVETSSGDMVFEHEFSDTQAEALQRMVHTSDEADDDGLGMVRELHWRLGDDTNEVDLDLNVLSDIDTWLDYALGKELYEGEADSDEEWQF